MKKNYLLILGMGLTVFSFGQKKITASEKTANPGKSAVDIKTVKPSNVKLDKAGGDVLYSYDFNGSIGTWTTAGADAAIWKFDTDGPNGEYSDPATEIIESTTAANGFMIFDADFSNTPGGGTSRSGFLVSPVIDLTGQAAVNIRFEHCYRTCCASAWIPQVEVSTDGFATFEAFDVTVPGIGVNDQSPTTLKELNISSWLATATNLSNFQFRFNWDGDLGTGTSHYHWQIDDVALVVTQDNDLELKEVLWGSTGVWATQPYFVIPESQIAPIEFAGVSFNNGALDQADAVFTVSTTDGIFSGTSDATLIPVVVQDTLELTTTFTPAAGTSTHEINFSLNSSAIDAVPSTNVVASELITMNKYLYAADNNFRDGTTYNQGQAYEVGNVFQIFNTTTLYAANVNINTGSTVGALIYAKLYDMDLAGTDLAGTMVYNAETQPYAITSADINNAWVTLAFDTPITLDPNKSYGLFVGSYGDGGATNDLVINTAGTSAILNSLYLDVNDNNTWYYTTGTPMIRMNFDPALYTPTITANNSTTLCEGQSVTLISSSTTGNVWSTGQTTRTIVVTAAGDYSVSAHGATSEVTTVFFNPNPTVAITSSNPALCAGGTVNLSATGAVSYAWSTGETSQAIDITTAGTYGVTISDGLCSASTTITVNAVATPTITASGSTTICDNGSVILTSSSPINNTWSTGATTQSIMVNTAQSVGLTVSEMGCNTDAANVDVVVNPSPVAALGTATSPLACGSSDGIQQLTGTETVDISWTGPVTGSMTAATLPVDLTALTAGAYSATLLNTTTGCSTVVPFTVSDPGSPAAPTITATSTTICGTGTVDLTASVGTDIQWSTGETTQTITVSAAGDYSVRTGIVGACISASLPTTITVATLPTVDGGADVTICAGEAVTLTGAGTSSYTWDNGAVNGVAFMPSATTTYTVTGMDFNGCTNTDAVVVTVNALPAVTAGADKAVCLGAAVTVTGSGAGTIATGASYLWNTGATTTSITLNPTADRTLILVGTDNKGCTNSDTMQITVNPLPVINFQAIPMMICIYNSTPIDLVATPAGGVFAGTGVSGTQFTATSVPNESVVTISYAATLGTCTATASQNIFVSACSSIEENTQTEIMVYPNPTTGDLTISAENLNDFNTIEIKDQVGRTVGSWKIDNVTMKVDVSKLAAGNYSVVVKGDKANIVQRVIVMD